MPFNLFRNKEKILEKDRQKLISDLETSGIKFLLDKMNSKEDYSPLISERRKTEMSFSSEDRVSWYA